MVIHHRVRLEYVTPDLTAEAHVGLRCIDGRLLPLPPLDFRLVELVLQHLHRLRLVLEL